jgi:dTDP-4-dehydrorhamnose 3,5-epimerase
VEVSRLEGSDIMVLQMTVYRDHRGSFQEVWNPARGNAPGLPSEFVQDNIACSRAGVLRGLHFQKPFAQGKLITVLTGEIFDVAVDLRPESGTFGKWYSFVLKGDSGQALYIPEGFAHGYQVLSEKAHVLYKCTEVYHPEAEHSLAWNDPEVNIKWPIPDPVLSDKDRVASSLADLRGKLIGIASAP